MYKSVVYTKLRNQLRPNCRDHRCEENVVKSLRRFKSYLRETTSTKCPSLCCSFASFCWLRPSLRLLPTHAVDTVTLAFLPETVARTRDVTCTRRGVRYRSLRRTC